MHYHKLPLYMPVLDHNYLNVIWYIVLRRICQACLHSADVVALVTVMTLQFNTGLEKNKLFLKGLPLTVTKSELEELFAEVSFF